MLSSHFAKVQKYERVGLNRTGHMSFLTGQDQTPKFAAQVWERKRESGF